MERNGNDSFGTQNSTNTTGGFEQDFGSTAGSTASTAGATDAFSRAESTETGLAERARDKAGNLKNTIADALASGAERLRQQGGQVVSAGTTGGGSVSEDNRLSQTSNQLAGGMQGAADWLRDADLEGVKTGLERQVKEHPGRTLAIALGVGYLLGKAFRR